jgi:sialidase-1
MYKCTLFLSASFFFQFSCLVGLAQNTSIVVFSSGEAGYPTFRIPAMIHNKKGHILAFCEGRKTGSADFGNVDIVLKRSLDGGRTWGQLEVVAENGNRQAGNPAPVIDLMHSEKGGRIFLFYNTGDQTEQNIREGKGKREVWYRISNDGGITWEQPVNITPQVHRLQKGNGGSMQEWRSYANTPGHALQIRHGKYRGRLVIAANHSFGPPQHRYRDYRAHVFFSDDGGRTFQLSEDVAYPGSNESMAAELGNGGILLNSRNQSGDEKFRLISRSSDGGKQWDTTYLEKTLIDPVNQGAVLTIGYQKGKAVMAHTHTQDSLRRNHLMLHISRDDGYSWRPFQMIDKAPDGATKDYTAYSDVLLLSRKNLGVLYERNEYREIVWKTVSLPRTLTRRKH